VRHEIRRVAGIYAYWRAIWAQRQMVVGGERARARSPHPPGLFSADVGLVANKGGEVKIEENRSKIGEEFKAHHQDQYVFVVIWKGRNKFKKMNWYIENSELFMKANLLMNLLECK
jgi:hypothetical protein